MSGPASGEVLASGVRGRGPFARRILPPIPNKVLVATDFRRWRPALNNWLMADQPSRKLRKKSRTMRPTPAPPPCSRWPHRFTWSFGSRLSLKLNTPAVAASSGSSAPWASRGRCRGGAAAGASERESGCSFLLRVGCGLLKIICPIRSPAPSSLSSAPGSRPTYWGPSQDLGGGVLREAHILIDFHCHHTRNGSSLMRLTRPH